MAGTFADVKTDLVAGVLNSHPNTGNFIASAMVRQLGNLQPEVIPFMEITGSFNTVAAQQTYSSAVTGFPKSMLRFDRLWYDLGNYALPLIVSDPGTIRLLQEQNPIAYPRRVIWIDSLLQFGPAPAASYTVKFDAILDARKDTATGNLITTASTTDTNPWFTAGVTPFMHLVWSDYYSTSPDTRPDMAQNHSNLAGVAMNRLRAAYKVRQAMGALSVTPNAFDTATEGSSARISRLFPGAPV